MWDVVMFQGVGVLCQDVRVLIQGLRVSFQGMGVFFLCVEVGKVKKRFFQWKSHDQI